MGRGPGVVRALGGRGVVLVKGDAQRGADGAVMIVIVRVRRVGHLCEEVVVEVSAAGEIAPAHRHSQTALRFLMEGQGGYTTVAGERVAMSPGDFVITPTWGWHDHGNLGAGPVVWLDGLDIPLVRQLGPVFAYPDQKRLQVLEVQQRQPLFVG